MQTVLMPEAVDQAAPPPPPATLEEAGLARDHVEQLLIKTLYGSELAGSVLAERVRLPYGVLEPLIERQRAERLIEVRDRKSVV